MISVIPLTAKTLIDELLADLSVNVENEVINAIDLQLLSEAILALPDDEKWLITELYMRDKPKTEQEITTLTGIPQQTVSYRKNKILKKLKNYLVRNQKSQQYISEGN